MESLCYTTPEANISLYANYTLMYLKSDVKFEIIIYPSRIVKKPIVYVNLELSKEVWAEELNTPNTIESPETGSAFQERALD